ncbi:MAG TPA: autotransporter domain-containing protein, partial [Dongiaceae bacterium]|nr:autotransporter domain-containing protein [Dongiaceae bacterium]
SLTGTGAFSSADVQSGDLRVNGQLTAPTVTVQSGGTLGGSGTIIGAVTADGTVAPGNSIGTLTINGNYTQATGSSYSVELDNTGASDLLDVTGAATIQGGSSVNVLAAPGSYTVGTRSTILTAAGGVTGTYDTLTDNAPFVDFVLNYDADDVFLDVLRSGVPFASVARTPNERAAAGAVDSRDAGNPVFDAVTALDAPAARHAFDLLSGEIHPTISETLVERSADLRDAVNDRLLQPFDGESLQLAAAVPTLDLAAGDGADCTFICATGPDRRLATWGRALGNWGHVDGDGNAGAADSETAGFISGIDATFDESWRIGIAAGYSHTGLDVPSRTSSASIDSYHIAAYGGFRSGNLTARLGAAYSFDDIGATRDADFAGFSGSTQSEYWARTAQAFGEAGYAFGTGRFTIMPVAGLAYINLDTDGFHEGDGPMGLHAQASDQDALFSNLELRGATRIDAGSLALGLHGMVGWRHAFGDVTPDTRFTFDGGGTGFTVAGAPIARDAALLEAGADADLGDGITLSLSYSGQAAPDSWTNGVAGDVRFRF